MVDQVAADEVFLEAFDYLMKSWKKEIDAMNDPGNARQHMVAARCQHALGMGLVLNGLDEPVG
jgi:hypothetical protein